MTHFRLPERRKADLLNWRSGRMLDVYLTVDVDVEVWCDGWSDIDARFPSAFRRYIKGPTAHGDYGLPYQLALLRDHGLKAVFFVEPLFATRFGLQPLADVVGMIQDSGQEVQLHLHTEWVDEAWQPLLPAGSGKRQHLRYFDLTEQTTLIAAGQRLLMQAGAKQVTAFRAGSFGFNQDTLPALRANGIMIDNSYNASLLGPSSGVRPGEPVFEAIEIEGMLELPMTVYHDGRALRHAQLTACSSAELTSLLWQAMRQEHANVVLLSHGFELLNRRMDGPDWTVVRRMHRLCELLDRRRDSFRTRGLAQGRPALGQDPGQLLRSPLWRTGLRTFEQAARRRHG